MNEIKRFRQHIPIEQFSTRNKLLAALAFILLVSFFGTSFINYSITVSAVRQQIIEKDLPLTCDNVYSDLTAVLNRPILVASSMAEDTFLKEWVAGGEHDIERITRYLKSIKDRYGFFSTFFISEKTARYYHFKGVHKVISHLDSHDVWYYTFISKNRAYELDVDNDQATGNTLTVFVNYRVVDADGTLLGVTGVGMRVDRLASMIGDYQRKYDRSIFLTDRNGLIQIHQDKALIEQQSIIGLEGLAPLAGKILATGKQPQNFRFSRNGDTVLLTVRYLDQLDWLLFVEQNETASLSYAKKNLFRTIMVGMVASIFIVSLTLFTINRFQARLEKMAAIDALTGVANRSLLEETFVRMLSLNQRNRQPFSLILLDLDGFKAVNDTLGHMVGDLVLRQVAGILTGTVRPADVVARWGGDEFVVLTMSGCAEAVAIGERLRSSVAAADLSSVGPKGRDPRNSITMSCGVAEFGQGDDLDALIVRADQAMYRSKMRGGNAVTAGERS